MTEREQILVETLRRTLIIESGGIPPGWDFAWRPDVEFERKHGPRWDSGRWFGGGERLKEAQRQRFVRALRALADSGHVVLASQYSRLSHVKLTDSGRAEAVRLSEGLKLPEKVTIPPAVDLDEACSKDP